MKNKEKKNRNRRRKEKKKKARRRKKTLITPHTLPGPQVRESVCAREGKKRRCARETEIRGELYLVDKKKKEKKLGERKEKSEGKKKM